MSLRCHFRSHCQVNNGTGFFSRKKKSHNYVEEMEEIVTFAFSRLEFDVLFWVRRVKMNTVFFLSLSLLAVKEQHNSKVKFYKTHQAFPTI